MRNLSAFRKETSRSRSRSDLDPKFENISGRGSKSARGNRSHSEKPQLFPVDLKDFKDGHFHADIFINNTPDAQLMLMI